MVRVPPARETWDESGWCRPTAPKHNSLWNHRLQETFGAGKRQPGKPFRKFTEDHDAAAMRLRLMRSRWSRGGKGILHRSDELEPKAPGCRGQTQCCRRKNALIALEFGSSRLSRCGATNGTGDAPRPGSGRRPRRYCGRLTKRILTSRLIPSCTSRLRPSLHRLQILGLVWLTLRPADAIGDGFAELSVSCELN